jgi:hypothetical protein
MMGRHHPDGVILRAHRSWNLWAGHRGPAGKRDRRLDRLASAYGPGYNGPLLTATKLSPPAHPSQAYEDKYNQAKANQADLERKQKTLAAVRRKPRRLSRAASSRPAASS